MSLRSSWGEIKGKRVVAQQAVGIILVASLGYPPKKCEGGPDLSVDKDEQRRDHCRAMRREPRFACTFVPRLGKWAPRATWATR